MARVEVPSMGEFLEDVPSNWGKWGPDDEIGSLNYLTPAEVMRGIRHVKHGKVITLQRLINNPKGDPVSQGRTGARVSMLTDESSWDKDDAPRLPGDVHYADDYIETFLHGCGHCDALGHVWYGGNIWNGYDARTTIGGMRKAGVLPIAEKGVVGRGILLDMARYRGKAALEKVRRLPTKTSKRAPRARASRSKIVISCWSVPVFLMPSTRRVANNFIKNSTSLALPTRWN